MAEANNGQERASLEKLLDKARQLSKDEQAALVKGLLGNLDMSICMGGFNANTVDVLVYVQSTDKDGLASVTEAIAQRILSESRRHESP